MCIITPLNTENWGEYYQITHDALECLVIPAAGGRLIPLTFKGVKLVRYDDSRFGQLSGAPRSTEEAIQNYTNLGGRVIWPAPQPAWMENGALRSWPPPIAFEGPWQVTERTPQSITLTSGVYRQMQITQVLDFSVPDTVQTTLAVNNLSDHALSPEISLWSVIQLVTGGRFEITGAGPEAIDVYADFDGYDSVAALMAAGIVSVGHNTLWMQIPQSAAAARHVKLGIRATGYCYHYHNLHLSVTRDGQLPAHSRFPHGNGKNPLEIYLNPGVYAEGEILSPLVQLQPGERYLVNEDLRFGDR